MIFFLTSLEVPGYFSENLKHIIEIKILHTKIFNIFHDRVLKAYHSTCHKLFLFIYQPLEQESSLFVQNLYFLSHTTKVSFVLSHLIPI